MILGRKRQLFEMVCQITSCDPSTWVRSASLCQLSVRGDARPLGRFLTPRVIPLSLGPVATKLLSLWGR